MDLCKEADAGREVTQLMECYILFGRRRTGQKLRFVLLLPFVHLSPFFAGGASSTSTSTHKDPCYVFFTSGSTGRPKGVVVEHRGLVHRSPSSEDVLSIICTISACRFCGGSVLDVLSNLTATCSSHTVSIQESPP